MSNGPKSGEFVIGVDLDNTLIDYEPAYAAALSRFDSSSQQGISSRSLIKTIVQRRASGNLDWTHLQADIYADFIEEARPFAASTEVLNSWIQKGIQVRILSHKTRYPAVGEARDLREAAKRWIEKHILSGITGLREDQFKVRFLDTLQEKIHAIGLEKCDVFIDDLAEVIEHPNFPSITSGIHFGIQSCPNWDTVAEEVDELFVGGPHPQLRESGEPRLNANTCLEKLLESLGESIIASTVLTGGINNGALRLETRSGSVFFGKYYRWDQNDPRDRMLHEIRFLEFCKAQGITCVPEIVATDWANRAAVFSYVNGSLWDEEKEVPSSIWQQFRDFYTKLQSFRTCPAATQLPIAAEGANSLQGHLGWLQKRRDSWRYRACSGALDAEQNALVLNTLEQEYQNLAKRCIAHDAFKTPFTEELKVISPSDFGLHNALVDDEGKVCFIDFEYAGWDWAPKVLIDFTLQPRYPADERFLQSIDLSDEWTLLIHDVLKLKWKYITLAYHAR